MATIWRQECKDIIYAPVTETVRHKGHSYSLNPPRNLTERGQSPETGRAQALSHSLSNCRLPIERGGGIGGCRER